MQQRNTTIAAPRSVPRLGPADYAVPVAWWGWSWEPPVPMSIAELVAAGDLDARTAALCWLVLAGHGSLIIAAEQPHSGKTTLLTALLDLLPERIGRVYLRGGAETFDFLDRTRPAATLLLANELSAHLPVYLWGTKAVRTFRTLRDGYALAATMHADSAAEAVAQLRDDLGADEVDLARVDLLVVLRVHRAGPMVARRVVSVHRRLGDGAVAALVERDAGSGTWVHDRPAERAVVAGRHGWTVGKAELAIARRADRIAGLVRSGAHGIDAVNAELRPLNDANEGDRS